MLTIKNVKHSKFASHETNCFECALYWFGEKAGVADNDGRGGCTHITWDSRDCRIDAEAWEEAQPDIVTDIPSRNDDGEFFSYTFDLEGHVDQLIETYLYERDLKNQLKRKLLIGDDDCKAGEFYTWTLSKYKGNSVADLTRVVLGAETFKNPVVLNSLPLDEALAIWRKPR
tara:strand:+ start:121 stop:636 length:516 start_codon:yes stop_codon:yes gene_type:complete